MKHLLLFFIIFFSSLVIFAQLESLPDTKIGTYQKEPFSLKDLMDRELHNAREQYYLVLEAKFQAFALDRIREKNPELFATQIKIKDQDAKNFYNLRDLKGKGSFQELKNDIIVYLARQKREIRDMAIYEQALKAGQIKKFFVIPEPWVSEVSTKGLPIRGASNAKVMVMEFSDYQCPFCARVQPTVDSLIKNYQKKVAFTYRHLPLPFHKEADEAAIAAECAREQGIFAPYHQALFKDQRKQFPNDLKKLARNFDIKDAKQFDDCLDNEKYRALVNKDMAIAQRLGINGTPGFIIGRFDTKIGVLRGELISGAVPENLFREKIEYYLK